MTAFFDTNIFVYAASSDPRAGVALDCLASGGIISVQILNELTNVLRRKGKLDWDAVDAILTSVRERFPEPRPLTSDTHAIAVELARLHGISFYDSLIVASAIEAKCTRLFTEDLQHGRKFGELTIHNPFQSN